MTREQAHSTYLLARRLKLSGWWLLRDKERAARECNGIGPEWAPRWMRWMIDHLCPNLVVVAMIHDLRYFPGGTVGLALVTQSGITNGTINATVSPDAVVVNLEN